MANKRLGVKQAKHKKSYAKKGGQAITIKKKRGWPLSLEMILVTALFFGLWLMFNDTKK